jgi:hypothetical protein
MIEKRTDAFGDYLYVLSEDIVTLNDMLRGLDFLYNDKTLPRRLRIVEDARNSTVDFAYEAILILSKRMHEVAKKYTSIRHAVIHNDPKNVALALLIEKKKEDENYFLGVFSTSKGAFNWLNIV